MNDEYRDIQDRYIAEMRAVLPQILAWWNARAASAPAEIRTLDTASAFELRWPAGPAAHPRIIEIFRRYFFEVDALNVRGQTELAEQVRRDPTDPGWGEAVPPPDRTFVLPIDLLVNDLVTVAPDLHEIMQGFVFVPIGADPEGEPI